MNLIALYSTTETNLNFELRQLRQTGRRSEARGFSGCTDGICRRNN